MRQGQRTDLRPYANLHKVSRTEAATMLNVSPRSVAAELANIKFGDFVGNQHVGSANLQTQVSQTEAATLLNVSPRSVATAAFRHGVAG
jgi:Mn-dependent DtxR family transcriptional regulator